MEDKLYFYRARVVSVYDGDTCTVDIDLGLKMWVHREKIRLNRIDTPEMRGPEKEHGKRSRDFLRGLILRREIMLQTLKDVQGKYGRYLGEIWLENENGWHNINDLMVQNGFAVYKKY